MWGFGSRDNKLLLHSAIRGGHAAEKTPWMDLRRPHKSPSVDGMVNFVITNILTKNVSIFKE